ncbi:hypothetical protein EXIGLDRAFT_755394 [Exidia glandulosa HHB12029]|uniref:Nudix hydrolase domain-containing protein n=1 Tax=Exidia glandulosa HHB12029 TaxID=1314781 RepID=A0A165C3F6_EXIGL|nr:hypothetical protein EXIGLDRAFT_755394 [Exidia glandulosa HHB12029]
MDLGGEGYEAQPTQNSTDLLQFAFWASPYLHSSLDFRIQTGVILIDKEQERVLFVQNDRLGAKTFPRGQSADIDDLLESPIRCAEATSDYKCERLALPILTKEYSEPEHKAVARITDELSDDPFYVTFDTLSDRTTGEKWPQVYQLITYWYAAYVDRDHPLSAISHRDSTAEWVPLKDAPAMLEGKDEMGSRSFTVFRQLWNYLKKPAREG